MVPGLVKNILEINFDCSLIFSRAVFAMQYVENVD